ncbi:hypothetical protein CBM2633_P30018 [Cupriavidus taiwanensis]|uniref:Uncharacterized protein n=3 Tax=Cupriavidus TaxID=106589 RepID=A0A375F844_9BURK|nr:hypothetical protein pRALTA_0027 [Cupriavidus taiwanensis LMG 19424]SOY75443.1 hypothetical protein CBM2588_P30017 [Cupriavidus taiwanensis]SOZ40588.1 hypothetical protein CBM2605_P30018 [Cupriavidus neocaledonicus]SOY75444.1 hypothetical protein CBM2592_P30017 [Cupriavidus taiwanensis]SOY75756.1 hypothetical protein CBM2585_P30018 [Cupriavidus taiwanensis]
MLMKAIRCLIGLVSDCVRYVYPTSNAHCWSETAVQSQKPATQSTSTSTKVSTGEAVVGSASCIQAQRGMAQGCQANHEPVAT